MEGKGTVFPDASHKLPLLLTEGAARTADTPVMRTRKDDANIVEEIEAKTSVGKLVRACWVSCGIQATFYTLSKRLSSSSKHVQCGHAAGQAGSRGKTKNDEQTPPRLIECSTELSFPAA